MCEWAETTLCGFGRLNPDGNLLQYPGFPAVFYAMNPWGVSFDTAVGVVCSQVNSSTTLYTCLCHIMLAVRYSLNHSSVICSTSLIFVFV